MALRITALNITIVRTMTFSITIFGIITIQLEANDRE